MKVSRDGVAPVVADGWSKPPSQPKPKVSTLSNAAIAVTPETAHEADLAALLAQYRLDGEFRAALIALAENLLAELGDYVVERKDWGRSLNVLRRDSVYVEAVEAFAATWKLDRLPDMGGEPAGLSALHAWLLSQFLDRQDGSWPRDVGPEAPFDAKATTFGGGVSAGALTLHIHKSTNPEHSHYVERDDEGNIRGAYVLRLPWAPIELRLSVPDPTNESRATAEARLAVELRFLLDKLYGDHRAAGYTGQDVFPQRDRDAGFFYRSLVKREDYRSRGKGSVNRGKGSVYRGIADEWNKEHEEAEQVDGEAVRIAVHRFRKRLTSG